VERFERAAESLLAPPCAASERRDATERLREHGQHEVALAMLGAAQKQGASAM
jgi:hypothetical protein